MEDARSLNFFLDSLILKINEYKTEIMYSGKTLTSQKVMDCNKPKYKHYTNESLAEEAGFSSTQCFANPFLAKTGMPLYLWKN
ncbi:hypothetical protein [Flavobacterium sp. 1]|uniref:hypothetical protein n=1 Tax=Flavobacterium sp. 1 TaxID=2035200 RepID=UPI000C25039F|nr:hypothetical protein [Flavobacterium sp. 1]